MHSPLRRFWWVPVALLLFFLVVQPRGNSQILPVTATVEPAVLGLGMFATPMPENTVQPVPSPTPSPQPTATLEPSPTIPAVTPTLAATSTPEPPALEPEIAPATPVMEPTTKAQPSQPVRLIVPQIDLDLEPMPVGLDEERVPIVPRHDVGWFEESAMPQEGSNVIFWAHVLRWKDSPNIPAPFARIHELQPGADLIVVTADGNEHRYRVTQQVQVRPEEVQYIYPTTRERVTLVSCIGDKVILNGTLTKEFRLVTIAEPVTANAPNETGGGAGS